MDSELRDLNNLSYQNSLTLTARDIYDQLVLGKEVTLRLPPQEAEFLFNHINVIKSRERKLRTDLGLEFARKILRKDEFGPDACNYRFRFVEPDPKKRYIAFVIEEKKS